MSGFGIAHVNRGGGIFWILFNYCGGFVMKKKFKGQVYRDAIQKLDASNVGGWSCNALEKSGNLDYVKRYSGLFAYAKTWFFCNKEVGVSDNNYSHTSKLGRRTREIALELAAHLEDIGEMDKILGEK